MTDTFSPDTAPCDFGEHPGYSGAFTRNQAPDAIPNRTRIKKAKSEPGDRTPVGCLGTVLGSICHPEYGILYFIEWDWKPGHAVATMAFKVAPAVRQ